MADPAPPTHRTRVRRNDKIGEVIAREILGQITNGGLTPGAQLPAEAQMMAEFQVGRGTLREALRILEVNGLIYIKPGPGGGPVVAEASTHDFGRMATLFFNARGVTVRELVESRLILEPITAQLAAGRRSPEGVAQLEQLVFDPEAGDEIYGKSSAEFHALIAQMAGNGVIALFSQSMAEVFHDRVRGMLFPAGKGRRAVLAAHEAIAKAVIAGDGETAQSLMLSHMEEYVKYVRKNYPAILDEVVHWLR